MGRLWEPPRLYERASLSDLFWEALDLEHGFTFLKWKQPSEEEAAVQRERRKRIFLSSDVPWIVTDLGGLMQFYDDAQDIISFAKWNRRMVLPTKREALVDEQFNARRKAAEDYKDACKKGQVRGRKRQAVPAMSKKAPDLGFLLPLALRMFPGTAPLMWGALAGQLLHMATGYGVSFGGVVGSVMETVFRGFGELGLPFDQTHNKWHQLTEARALKWAEKGIGSMIHLPWSDQFMAIKAIELAIQDFLTFERVDIPQDQYPDIREVLSDPWGTFKSLYHLQDSMLGNAGAYATETLLPGILQGMGKLLGGSDEPNIFGHSPEQQAVLSRLHGGRCLADTVCGPAWMDAIAVEAWAMAKNLFRDRIGNVHTFADYWTGTMIVDPDRLGQIDIGESLGGY